MPTTVADLIVARLAAAGVRALFGVPGGGGNLDLIEAARRAGLRFVLTSTETGGAIAAMAEAEVTGQLGACLTTLGPGATSVVNGVACAWLDRAPIVVFTDTYAASGRGVFEHQAIDHQSLMRPITKLSERLAADDAVTSIDRALEIAIGGRPGPVHLDCPGDVLGVTASDAGASAVAGARVAAATHPPPALDLLLARARKPLLLVGAGARRPEDADAIRHLCAEHAIPAMVTYKAKGVVPDTHAWCAGVFTNGAIEQDLLAESDLLIGLGLDPVELLPRAWIPAAPVVYCGPWPVQSRHPPFAASWVIDIPAAVSHIESTLACSAWSQADVAHAAESARRSIREIGSSGFTAQRVVDIAARALPAHRVTVDAGAHMFPATMLWPVSEPGGMLISNGLSTMAFALPAAIGASIATPDRPVVALIGDGGLLMCAGELLTLARERLPVLVIVFNDASLSLIEIKQQQRRLPAAGVALGGVDWTAVARGFGLAAFRASDEDGLAEAIARAVSNGGPALIDVAIDRSNYPATLRALRG